MMGMCSQRDGKKGSRLMMRKYQPITPEIIEALKKVVGEKYVLVSLGARERYQTDEETDPRLFHTPEAVVSPGSTAEVAAIMQLANKYDFPVTPRSGGTSVSCGAIAVCGGIIMLMERLNKIEKIDSAGMYMTVEAGVKTIDIQRAAKEENLFYAGDPCSAENCLIGGNLATNAGGNKAVRYGTTRNQVYSIEVVTPTGEITNLGARLKKCSTGYCLDQLVIGSEGTLGIITKATLKLLPLAPYKMDVLAIFTDVQKATGIVPILVRAGLNPTSVEFMDNSFVRVSSDYSELQMPHYADGSYVIISIETFDEDELEKKIDKLQKLCLANGATDVLDADERVWTLRRNCLESTMALSPVSTSDDFVVPQNAIALAIDHLCQVAKKYPFRVFTLAHAGDGNLHFQILKGNLSDKEWEDSLNSFHTEAYEYIYAQGGRLSGEHGIGAKKVRQLEKYTNPVELEIMRSIKKALDPKDVLNPGKVFNV